MAHLTITPYITYMLMLAVQNEYVIHAVVEKVKSLTKGNKIRPLQLRKLKGA